MGVYFVFTVKCYCATPIHEKCTNTTGSHTMIARILNVKLLQTLKLKWFLMDKNGSKFSYVTELPFKDYFFCRATDIPILKDQFPDTEFETQGMSPLTHQFEIWKDKQDMMWKVSINNPFTKYLIRSTMEDEHNILLYEADIQYVDLVLKDLNIYSYVEFKNGVPSGVDAPDDFPELKVAYFDFETDDRQSSIVASELEDFAKIDTCRILSASIMDAETEEIFHYVNIDEEKLTQEIADKLNEYHIIQAWNGRGFDFLYLKRIEEMVENFNSDMFIKLDAMLIHAMLNPKERDFVSLDMAGQRYLGLRKIPHDWGFYEAFVRHREALKEYNNRDVYLMHQLEKKFGYAGIVMQTADQIGFLPQKYIYSRYSSIIAVMRVSMDHHDKRIVWKSKSNIPLLDKYEGALVLDSVAGRWKNVIGIDLMSLYNYIIQTFNISPEQISFDENGKHSYDRFDHEGIMPRVLRMFETERNRFKALRNSSTGSEYQRYEQIQAGLKIVLLSIYGGLGARGSTKAKASGKPSGAKSFYNFHCANDTTYHARQIITIAKDVVEQLGYKVVYGDTDSLYIFIGDEDLEVDQVKKILSDIVQHVNNEYVTYLDKYKVPEERRRIQMEAQGWYSPFVLFGKKKYYFAQEIYNAENDHVNEEFIMYSKGIKVVKISEPKFIREFQAVLYRMILNYAPKQEVIDYINTTRILYDRGNYDDKLIFESRISKKISEYKSKTPHIHLAERLINQGSLQEKSILFYVISYTEMKKPVAEIEGSKIHSSGRRYVWDHRIQGWIDEIMELIFGSQEQSSLDSFF